MDIIAAHQQGLIEQLDEEAVALAGRPGDHGQRAVVLHHLYDHSRGGHVWALAEARRTLRISEGIGALKERLRRWGWLTLRRGEAEEAVSQLASALGEASRARCAAVRRAYRMTATPALRSEAERILSPDLFAALDACHASRRSGEAVAEDMPGRLAEQCELLAGAAVDRDTLAKAWAAIDATGLRRAARRLLGDRALARAAARDQRRGWAKVERQLRYDPTLPASFHANPAQHFYVLQNNVAERRRQQWREDCDREPDAFELAA